MAVALDYEGVWIPVVYIEAELNSSRASSFPIGRGRLDEPERAHCHPQMESAPLLVHVLRRTALLTLAPIAEELPVMVARGLLG